MTEIQIVHDHPDWLICNKPAGLNFHNEDGELGLVSLMRKQLGTDNIWPVHRLDKLTSGLILLARSKESCSALCELFAQREVEKYYLAICPKTMKKKQGWVIGDMAKGRRGAYKLLASKDNPSVTQFYSQAIGGGLRLCLLKPKTGKTHQLRVALKSLGSPIVGDQSYAGSKSDRLYLHAYAIKFSFQNEEFNFQLAPDLGALFLQESVIAQLNVWGAPWLIEWPKSK